MNSALLPPDSQHALARAKAAISRIEIAAEKIAKTPTPPSPTTDSPSVSSAKVTALVNKHEAMREDVAVTMRELDSIISKLEI